MGPRPTSRREAELPAGPEGQPGGAAALLGRGLLPGGRHLGQRPGQSHPGLREALQAQRTGMVSAGGYGCAHPTPSPSVVRGGPWDVPTHTARRAGTWCPSWRPSCSTNTSRRARRCRPPARSWLTSGWVSSSLPASLSCLSRAAQWGAAPGDGGRVGGRGVTVCGGCRSSSWSTARCCGRHGWRCAVQRRSPR